jgi:agmatine/peptidylarginine deiminase
MRSFLPPEWAPQAAVMLTWPRSDGDFAEVFGFVEQNFIDLAVAISRYAYLHVNYSESPEELRDRLVRAGAEPSRVRVISILSDDVWARDHGPITVMRDGKRVHLDFGFNGWGDKFPHYRDNLITRGLDVLGSLWGPVETIDFILEGGSLEVDGEGTLLTTERCLLAPTRNPGRDQGEIEQLLIRELGVRRILWLKRGDLIGDDTDGHIDTLARFAGSGTIVYQSCADKKDAHYEELAAMEAELRAFKRLDGVRYELAPLPLPRPIIDEEGRRLPAGYANFLIVNAAVLVPTYGGPEDALALSRLRPCFPGREIVGIDCQALIQQYGSLHCVTMQIPEVL